jgi:hypothetical protein
MTENSVKPSQIKNLPWVYVIENPNTITIDKINSDEYIHDNFENIVSYKFINDFSCGRPRAAALSGRREGRPSSPPAPARQSIKFSTVVVHEDCPFCGITNCNCGSGY